MVDSQKACQSYEFLCWMAGQPQIMAAVSSENRKKVEELVYAGTTGNTESNPHLLTVRMLNDSKICNALMEELSPEMREEMFRNLWKHYGQ